MKKNDNIFVSLIITTYNSASVLQTQLIAVEKYLSDFCEDYEVIVVDNASEDETLNLLQKLTQKDGIPNLQVYALTKEVSYDVASWVGIENSLGDVVIVFDPYKDDLEMIPQMLELYSTGTDVVFVKDRSYKTSLSYSLSYSVYNFFFRTLSGVNLTNDSTNFRSISKKVVNYLLKFPNPIQQYRFLSATAGFSRRTVFYDSNKSIIYKKSVKESFERGISLLVSTTKAPMRIANFCSLFGAVANLIYSIYVVYIGFTKIDVAPGWITLSLQQSGMFFLISVVLFILGEYILHMAKLSSEGPRFHIAQEMTSAVIRHREKLNVTN